MTDYTRMIEELSAEGAHSDGVLQDTDVKLLLDTQTRIITPEKGFITTIGTTNEVNANVITIKCSRFADGHDLFNCKNKILKWSVAGGEKGTNVLEANETDEATSFELKWLIPPEAYVAAGIVKISISFYDTNDNGEVTYRWNSIPYNGLNVAKGMDEVSLTDFTADEIVYIDLATRKVNVPAGMNTQLGFNGEVGFSKIKFRCDRFYRGYDFKDALIQVCYVTATGTQTLLIGEGTLIPGTQDMDAPENKSDLIEFYWDAYPALSSIGTGTLQFSILMQFVNPVGLWKSEVCSAFTVGMSIGAAPINPEPGNNEIYIADPQQLNSELNEFLDVENTTEAESFTTTEAIMYTLDSLFNAEVVFHSDTAQEMYP